MILKKGLFKLIINDREFERTDDYFKHFKTVRVVFGKNDIISYETSDVPAMSIRDIRIRDSKGKQKYHWQLARHTQNGVYDEVERRLASCKAPQWLLDSHTY
ncbi:MAG: hypothetical protein LUE93_13235 [Bacteroides sp.]|nr:hypothetical protein [Bacteroides sp.]